MTLTSSQRKWWVLAATSGALSLIFLDQSALPVALPTIQRELDLSLALSPWVMNAYILVLAVLIILGGKLGDRWGHRRLLLSGMSLFVIASILCAVAPTGEWLVVSRALQGAGGALMMPSSGPLFRTVVDANEYGKMIGIYVSIASVFLIVGPSLGGLLTAYLSWRWIFWINFPVALAAILITIFVIPPDVEHPLREKTFDWLGFFSLTLFVTCLVFAFMQGGALGWTSPIIISCFVLSPLALIVFLKAGQRHPTPFVDLALFKDACIARCTFIMMLIQMAYMSIIFWAIFLQNTLFLSPLKTGIYLLAAQVPVLFFSNVAGRMLDRFGPRLPVTLGIGMIAISSLWIAIFSWQHAFIWLFPALLLFGMGSPLVSIGVMSTVVSAARAEKRGIVSGVIGAARQIGGAVGLALLVALVVHITEYGMSQWLSSDGNIFPNLHVGQLNALLNGTPLPEQLHLSLVETTAAHTAAIHAYTLGFSGMMCVVTAFAFISLWIASKLPNEPLKVI